MICEVVVRASAQAGNVMYGSAFTRGYSIRKPFSRTAEGQIWPEVRQSSLETHESEHGSELNEFERGTWAQCGHRRI
jgi:hypothetical protein